MDPPSAPNTHPRRSQHPNAMPTPAVSRTSTLDRQYPMMMAAVESGRRKVTPYTTVGQFSYAPTTQTTVVTTTTTTTTTFPPLVMKPPRQLNELDPKEYPLASVPTPSILKRFCFDVNGKPTYFREEDNAEDSIRQVRITPLEAGA